MCTIGIIAAGVAGTFRAPGFARTAPAGTSARLRVVVTTTHLGALVSAIGRGRTEAVVLVPGGMCPGHFDISPAVVRRAEGADLFLRHAWERWVADTARRLTGSEAVAIASPGNWMVPERNLAAAEAVRDALARVDPAGSGAYHRNYAAYHAAVDSLARWLDREAAAFRGVPVAASAQQREFLERVGMLIAAEYGRAEDMSAREVTGVIDAARAANVRLVVDNLQSGPDAGAQIARDLGVPHVTLTNFPLDAGYEAALRANVASLRRALRARRR